MKACSRSIASCASAATISLLIAASAGSAPETAAAPAHGLDLAGIDHSVQPGADFFAYANGNWMKTAQIPPDRSAYGVGVMLVELTDKRTAALIQAADVRSASQSAESRQIGDYYATFMDEAAVESRGLQPLAPALQRIAAIADRGALSRALGGSLRADVDIFNNTNLYTDKLFGLWVAQDLDDPTRYSPFLLQGGLDMPDRDYYLDSSARMAAIRDHYKTHIENILTLAHVADAHAKAARIFDLEHRIAAAHSSREESEDVLKGNNRWARRDFALRAPGLEWAAFFKAAQLDGQSEFTVWQPRAVSGISALVASEPLDAWKDYLTFHAIEHAATYLPKAFVDEHFAFHGKVLAGTPAQRERWKRGVDATNTALGEVVGKLYVQRYFPPAEKARAEMLVANLVAAFARRIDRLEWMAPQTKVEAKKKLATLKVGVGYPDKWRDYSALKIVRGDALGNFERTEQFEYQRSLAKLGTPVDRSEWVMNPQLVNAVNLPAMNALNIPAAILQPPYFDPQRPEVMDYGATGATIGHEISHSFDDQGALFDATGRLHNWWTKEDFAHFKTSAARLVLQYNAYRPFPDLAVNGKQTLSENIADVAGLAVTYDAYRAALHGKEAPAAQGFSADQQFFISFAQSWRQKIREPALRERIITDGHAPDEYRADTVRNLDAWYPAFAVKPGQALYLAPQERVHMW
ncbi:MAG TPA: M13 family metallopeptidase [Steroidobacteraceae bacterium]|jgi:putative endopeptidase|nr:M13 family metallopeptidase [Steroidobacteraceae bacterium]